jgi:hypothetical protein
MRIPGAPRQYDPRDQDVMRATIESAITTLEQKPNTSHLSGNRGDADVTLNAGTDLEIQRFLTALTTNRTVTLGQGHAGAKFTVMRPATGASTLDVGPGLKTLAAGQWVDVAHDGTAWLVVRFGSL